MPDHLREALGGLERDVAHEPVTDHDVDAAEVDAVAFHVAGEVQLARAQQLSGLLHDLIALDRLGPDVEQPDARPLAVLDGRNEDRAHHRELEQMLGSAIRARTEIEHVGLPRQRREHGDERGPIDAGERPQHEVRGGHQRAGIPSAHRGVRLAALHEVDRHSHRRVLLAFHRRRRLLVHPHDLARMPHANARRGWGTVAAQLRFDRFAQADEDHRCLGIRFEKAERSGNDHGRTMVAAHAIDRQRDLACRHRSAVVDAARPLPLSRRIHAGAMRQSLLVLTTFLPR